MNESPAGASGIEIIDQPDVSDASSSTCSDFQKAIVPTAVEEAPAAVLESSIPTQIDPLATVMEHLEGIDRKQTLLQNLFEQKLLFDATRQQLLDKMHAELQEYKADILLKTMQPMALSLIKLQDDMGKLTDAHRERCEGNEAATSLVKLIDQLGSEVRDILTLFGFEPFVVLESKFDGKRQRVIKRVMTNDPEGDQRVVGRVRPGFMCESRVLRPELVHVSVYEAPGSAEHLKKAIET